MDRYTDISKSRSEKMLNKKTFRFKCQEFPADRLKEYSPDRIIHVKGYASRLHDNHFPPELIELIEFHDVIVFDGDELKHDSFTKFFPIIAMHYPVKVFLAFRFEDHLPGFLTSWQQHVDITFEPDRHRYHISLSSESCPEHLEVEEISIHYVSVSSESRVEVATMTNLLQPQDNLWLFLGKWALQVTQARKILTLGGGACVVEEYHHSADDVDWYLFDFQRDENQVMQSSPLLTGNHKVLHKRVPLKHEKLYLIGKDRTNVSF